MSEFERGFRAGVEAAARVLDGYMSRAPSRVLATLRVAHERIRSLAPPSPEPATGGTLCDACGAAMGAPAPAPGPERCGHDECERCGGYGDDKIPGIDTCPECGGTGVAK